MTGYCYLAYFDKDERRDIARIFGRYPPIAKVAWEIYSRGYDLDRLLPDMSYDGCVYHVLRDGPKITVADFLYIYLYDWTPVGGNGYCYLTWMSQLGWSRLQMELHKRRLGRFPEVSSVIMALLSARTNRNALISGYSFSRSGVIHVSENYPRIKFHDLLIMLRPHIINRALIGGDKDVIAIRSVDTDTLDEMIRLSGKDMRAYFTDVMQQQIERPNSDLSKQLIDTMTHRIVTKLSTSKNIKLILPFYVDALAEGTFKSNFREFDISFKNSKNHPHAKAGNARLCDENLALYKLRYTTSSKVPPGYDCLIKDIGGNARSHFARSRYNVHSCMPVLDVRDAVRATKCREFLREKANRSQIYKQILADSERTRLIMCDRKGEECVLTAPHIILVHSMYDMSTQQIADSFDLARATSGIGALHFDPKIIDPTIHAGYMPATDCHWTKDIIKGTITFGFRNDSSFNYTHKLSTYLGLLTVTCIVSSTGVLYSVEQIDHRLDTRFFEITRCDSTTIPKSVASFRIWFPENFNKTAVTYYGYVPSGYPKRLNIHFRSKLLLVPTRMVESGKAYAYAQTQQKFSVNAIFQFLRGINNRYIINGVDVVSPDPLDSDTLYELAHALFVYAFEKRYRESTAMTKITDYLKDRREYELQSFLGRCWTFIADGAYNLFSRMMLQGDPAKPIAPIGSDDEYSVGLLGKLYLWMEKPSLFSINISEAVQFNTYESHIQKVSMNYLAQNFTHEFINQNLQHTELCTFDVLEEAIRAKVRDFVGVNGVTNDLDARIDGGAVTNCNYKTTTCTHILSPVQVPGDGDCLFHSIIRVLDLDINAKELRYELLRSKFLHDLPRDDMMNQDRLLKSEGRDGWGDLDTVHIAAMHFGVTICVHYKRDALEDIHLRFGESIDGPTVHIEWDKNHFTPLIDQSRQEFVKFLDTEGVHSGYAALIKDASLPFWQDIYDTIWNRKFKDLGDRSKMLHKLGLYINASAYKLHEIVGKFSIQLREPILDCCGSPGGFTQFCLRKGVSDITSFSIIDDYKREHIQGANIIISGIEEFEPTRRYHTVLADGATENSYHDDSIFRQEWELAQRVLEIGGDLIIKHNNYFNLDPALAQTISKSFSCVTLDKPFASKAGNPEFYFVCRGYMNKQQRPITDDIKAQLVRGINEYYVANVDNVPMIDSMDDLQLRYGVKSRNAVTDVESGACDDLKFIGDTIFTIEKEVDKPDLKQSAIINVDKDTDINPSVIPENAQIEQDNSDLKRLEITEILQGADVDPLAVLKINTPADFYRLVDVTLSEDSVIGTRSTVSDEKRRKPVLVDAPALKSQYLDRYRIEDAEACVGMTFGFDDVGSSTRSEVSSLEWDGEKEIKSLTSSSTIYKELPEKKVIIPEPFDLNTTCTTNTKRSLEWDFESTPFSIHSTTFCSVIKQDCARLNLAVSIQDKVHLLLCEFFSKDKTFYVQGMHYLAYVCMNNEVDFASLALGIFKPFVLSPNFDYAKQCAKEARKYFSNNKVYAALLDSFPWAEMIIGSITCGFTDMFYKTDTIKQLLDIYRNNIDTKLTISQMIIVFLQMVETKMGDYMSDNFAIAISKLRSDCPTTVFLSIYENLQVIPEYVPDVEAVETEVGKPKKKKRGFLRRLIAPFKSTADETQAPQRLLHDPIGDTVLGYVNEIKHHGKFINKVYREDIKTTEILGCPVLKNRVSRPVPDEIDCKIIARRVLQVREPQSSIERNIEHTKKPIVDSDFVFPLDKQNLQCLPAAGFSPLTTPLARMVTDYDGQKGLFMYIYTPANVSDSELYSLYCKSFEIDIDAYYEQRKQSNTLTCGLFVVIKSTDDRVLVVLRTEDNCVNNVMFDALKALPRVHPDPLIVVVDHLQGHIRSMSSIRLMELFSHFTATAYPHRYYIKVVGGVRKVDYDAFNKHFESKVKSTVYKDQSMYEAWRRNDNYYPDYRPKRRSDLEPVNVMRNAMDEVREYWRVKEGIILSMCRDFFSKMKSVMTVNDRQRIADSSEGFGLIDSKTKKWVIKPNFEKTYQCVFDGAAFIAYEDFKSGKVVPSSHVVLVCAAMELMQDAKLYSVVKDMEVDKFNGVELENRQGVPGCGKTYNFLQTCVPPTAERMGDLVLFPTREGCADFREKVKNKYPTLDDNQLKRNYKTLDSYLLNSGPEMFERLMVDEALMVHVGQILFCAVKARVTKVITIGDSNQIPFINRIPQCPIMYSDPMKFVYQVTHLSVSYRCTLTTAALLSPSYEKGMQSVNRVINDISTQRFMSIGAVPKDDKYQYLVFTQAEKLEMKNHGFDKVMTIHEYQGKQADNIMLVRTSMKKMEIYKSAPHALVAISRHRKKFVYVSPTLDDAVGKYVERARYMTTFSQLEKYFAALQLSGGATDEYTFVDMKGVRVFHPNVDSCVTRHGYEDLPTLLAEKVTKKEMIANFRPEIMVPCITDVGLLQDFIDTVLPGVSEHDYNQDPEIVEHSDMDLRLENTTLNPDFKIIPKTVTFDRMRPVLRTAVPKNRPSNQIEGLLAMIKRNQAVVPLAQINDEDELANLMLDRFMLYLVPEARRIASVYRNNPIKPNTVSISNWLSTQPTGTVDKIEQDDHISQKRLTNYTFMIKSTVKPQLDVNAPYTYSALQTIAYHDKDINAIFCPIFRDLKTRVVELLKDKFLINIDMSHEDFENQLLRRIRAGQFRGKERLEVDMSKYDKSQGKVMLLFETKLMRYFGIDEELVRLWYNAHVRTRLVDRANKISCYVNYQRKSGDASTFVGNTFFLMAVLATLFDMDEVTFGCFGGDDSLIVGGEEITQSLSDACASLFNLESKFFRDYKVPYFCSKFLIEDDYGYLFVPDPVKLITKLGRHDLVNPDHVEEYRVSLMDLVKPFANALTHDSISMAVRDRYRTARDYSAVFSALYNIICDKTSFHALYYYTESDNINYDPSRPNIFK